jgi:hypothetical protein
VILIIIFAGGMAATVSAADGNSAQPCLDGPGMRPAEKYKGPNNKSRRYRDMEGVFKMVRVLAIEVITTFRHFVAWSSGAQ